MLLVGSDNPDYVVDITSAWPTKIEAILAHTSQIGGRTREDFYRIRKEQVEREGDSPIEERFRRWSLRRPAPRPQQQEEKGKAEARA